MLARDLKSHEPTIGRSRPILDDFKNTCDTLFQIECLLQSLLADCCSRCARYAEADYTHDLKTLLKRVRSEGIGFAARTLPTLAKSMFTYLETGVSVYPGFKLQTGTKYPRFLKGIFYVIYGSFTDWEKAHAIDCVYQISYLFKKLEGEYDEKVLTRMYCEFKETDADMARVFDSLSDYDFETLQLARYYFKCDWLNFDLDGDHCIPRPGPGATRTKVPKHLRYEPHVFYKMHQHVFPYEEWFYPSMWSPVDEARNFLRMVKNPALGSPIARMMYVPKYYGTPRGICIEENESQWLQQGCANGMRAHVKRVKRLNGHVNFSDQSINRDLALTSSKTREYSTIDMEGGSDRHPRDIVSWVTQDNMCLHNALMCLSTREIEAPVIGETVDVNLRLHKFAPMGSGLCFPIMSLMHYYLILAIVNRAHSTNIEGNLYVYGDDIVLPSKYADTVFTELPSFGMKLNRNKSFAQSKFRESCGIHAYDGVDITPVFVRQTIKPGKIDSMVSAYATEYLLFTKGLFHVAKCLRTLYGNLNHQVPFITTTSPLIGWKRPISFLRSCPDGFTLEGLRKRRRIRRANKKVTFDPQCFEYRVRFIKTRTEPDIKMPDTQGYMRWFAQNTEESSTYRGAPRDATVTWGWKTQAECMPETPEGRTFSSCTLYRAQRGPTTARVQLIRRSSVNLRYHRVH